LCLVGFLVFGFGLVNWKVVVRLHWVVPAHPMLVSFVKVVEVLLSLVACAVRVLCCLLLCLGLLFCIVLLGIPSLLLCFGLRLVVLVGLVLLVGLV